MKLQLTDELIVEWDCWRLVDAGWETVSGLDLLSFDDVDVACIALDACEQAAQEAQAE